MKIKRAIKNLSASFAVGFILSGCATTDAGEIALPVVQPGADTAIEKPKQAEEEAVPTVRLAANLFCSPAKHVIQKLTMSYGEEPILSFNAKITEFPVVGPLPTMLFANPTTGAMSLVVFIDLTNSETLQNEKFACISMFGDYPIFSDTINMMKKRNYGPTMNSEPPGPILNSTPRLKGMKINMKKIRREMRSIYQRISRIR